MCRVEGLESGFRVLGLVEALVRKVEGCGVEGLVCRVEGSELRVFLGFGLSYFCLGLRVWGLGRGWRVLMCRIMGLK